MKRWMRTIERGPRRDLPIAEMANACLNGYVQSGRGDRWHGDDTLGWFGRPRVPARCMVGVTGVCTCGDRQTEADARPADTAA